LKALLILKRFYFLVIAYGLTLPKTPALHV